MTGQFENGTAYWTLTQRNTSSVFYVDYYSYSNSNNPTNSYGSRPTMNLKQNVVITGGKGTKKEPFTLKLGE